MDAMTVPRFFRSPSGDALIEFNYHQVSLELKNP